MTSLGLVNVPPMGGAGGSGAVLESLPEEMNYMKIRDDKVMI